MSVPETMECKLQVLINFKAIISGPPLTSRVVFEGLLRYIRAKGTLTNSVGTYSGVGSICM